MYGLWGCRAKIARFPIFTTTRKVRTQYEHDRHQKTGWIRELGLPQSLG